MKSLKLDHHLAELVRKGEKISTWRLFDDKDLSVNDRVQLIDKVDPHERSSWRVIGTAVIDRVVEKRLGEITDEDMDGHEHFETREAMIAAYRGYYGADVSWQTPVKIIYFNFTPGNPVHPADILPRVKKAVIYADGGSRGNPGPSASGYAIYDDNNTMLVNRGSYIGVTTNNQAEYTALKLALEEAKTLGAQEVDVYMDSLLVVNQMRGIYKVKNRDLWPVHDSLKELCKQFKHVKFTQVPRELNKVADAAVNAALDAHLAEAAGRS